MANLLNPEAGKVKCRMLSVKCKRRPNGNRQLANHLKTQPQLLTTAVRPENYLQTPAGLLTKPQPRMRIHVNLIGIMVLHNISYLYEMTPMPTLRMIFGILLLVLGACSNDPANQPQPSVPTNPLPGNLAFQLIEDEFQGEPVVLVGSGRRNLIVAFKRELGGQLFSARTTEERFPALFEDDRGNVFDVFGKVIQGPDAGEQLESLNSGMGYWFAFAALYPGAEIFGRSDPPPTPNSGTTQPGWDIPTSFVAQGSGFDAIAALDAPKFTRFRIREPNFDFFLDAEDLLVVLEINGEEKVYPHKILDWHEIVNDEIGGEAITLTYCPFTGTAKVWKRQPQTRFGVSGLLYNSNVLPFDRETESFWTQLDATSVFGERRGEKLELIPFVETTWESWQLFNPEPLILSTDTGIDRDYDEFPYGNYKTSSLVPYPLSLRDERLPIKERVYALIVEDQVKVYRLSDF